MIVILCILNVTGLWAQSAGKVSCETKVTHSLSLSQIAESTSSVTLETTGGKTLYSISQFFKIGKHIFITEGHEEEKGFTHRILIFNSDGKFTKEIENLNNISAGPKETVYSHKKAKNQITQFDEYGNLLDSFIVNTEGHIDEIIYQNEKLWILTTQFQSKSINYYLYSSDTKGKNLKIEKQIKEALHKGLPVSKPGNISANNGTIYFSMGVKNSDRLFKIQQGKITEEVQFIPSDINPQLLNLIVAPPLIRVGKYEFWGYNIRMSLYQCIFDTEADKYYNIMYIQGEKTSGIQDDIFGTGTFIPLFSTNSNSVYFYKRETPSASSVKIYYATLK